MERWQRRRWTWALMLWRCHDTHTAVRRSHYHSRAFALDRHVGRFCDRGEAVVLSSNGRLVETGPITHRTRFSTGCWTVRCRLVRPGISVSRPRASTPRSAQVRPNRPADRMPAWPSRTHQRGMSGTTGFYANKVVIAFPSPTGTWGRHHWFISDASSGGNIIAAGPLNRPIYVVSGDGQP